MSCALPATCVQVRKEYEDRANAAKERYLEEKKIWLAQRAAGMTQE